MSSIAGDATESANKPHPEKVSRKVKKQKSAPNTAGKEEKNTAFQPRPAPVTAPTGFKGLSRPATMMMNIVTSVRHRAV